MRLTLAFAVVSVWASTFLVQPYVVDSTSMEPAILPGDSVLVDKNGERAVRRGDVIVFRDPVEGADPLVKRVIGLPGESIHIEHGRVTVNGEVLSEPYKRESGLSHCAAGCRFDVPAAHYFVLGDNRDHSIDSRVFGFVPASHVMGRPWLVFWSTEDRGVTLRPNARMRELAPNTTRISFRGTRWQRFFQIIR
ncbi:MAG: signal peptidase I [Bryobacteraceae bacterium]|nr:signal peptidase I [Bryobacteraceae bacterium]